MQLLIVASLFKVNHNIKPMKIISILSTAIISSLFITSCDWYSTHHVIGKGDVETMEAMLPAFSGVSVTGTCDVDIQVGEAQFVEFSAQSEILDVMSYEVHHGILEIGFKKGVSVKTHKDISANIVIPGLSYVAITGASDFELTGLKQELLDIYITGTGNVNSFDLEVENCDIRISGAGNCEVNVSNSLNVDISGVGNIVYQGQPAVSSDISGVGHVTAANR